VPPPAPDPPPVTPPAGDPAAAAGATGTGATVPPPAAGTPPAGTPPAGTAGTGTTPGTPGTAPGRTGGAAVTPGGTPVTPGRSTDPAAAGTPPAAGRAGAPATNDVDASFVSVKLFTFEGRKTNEQDVTVNFGSGQVAVVPKNGGAPVATMAYRRIVRATYIRAENPRWDPALPGPAEKLDLGGVFNRDRHWLMLQAKDGYTLLRLDGDAWLTVLQTFESRTGIKIDRPSR
jgi:hypothetical protein